MKRYVINSDDFGLCHSVNLGVVQAFTQGLLTQASIMATAPWFEEAVELAKKHEIPVGVHLTATCEWEYYRWRPITGGRSLCRGDGTFHASIPEAQQKCDPIELENEFVAQVETVLSRGLAPQHIDLHMGVVNPQVFAKICRKYKLPGYLPDWCLSVDPVLPKVCHTFASRDDFVRDADPFSTKPLAEKKKLFRARLENLSDGDHYSACHVSVDSDEVDSFTKNPELRLYARDLRVNDLALLCDAECAELYRKLGIHKVAIRDLSPNVEW